MKKRIFLAIDISEKARAKASKLIEKLRHEFSDIRVGWEKPEKLHLTLKFLGDLDKEQLQNLTEAVSKTVKQNSNFRLTIEKTGVFPSRRNARILWLGVADEQEKLRELNENLERECGEAGFARENRNFKPHLTIARLREPHKSTELVERHLMEEFTTEEFEISEIVIYESQLQKSGSIYSIVSKHQLVENQTAN